MVHVPFKGDAPAITALLAGEIQIYFGGPLVLSPHIEAGRVRGLAVTSEERSQILPELPAVNEVVPGYSAHTWFGMWAPLGREVDQGREGGQHQGGVTRHAPSPRGAGRGLGRVGVRGSRGYSRIARVFFAAGRSQQRFSHACSFGHFDRSRNSAR